MFMLIDPTHHCLYKSQIELFLKLMKKHQYPSLSISEGHNSTFIMTENGKRGAYGGAQLFQKKVKHLPENIRKHIDCFLSQNALIWICRIFLHIENEAPPTKVGHFESFCRTCYRKLYEKLIEFGECQGMGFLCMDLSPAEYLSTEEMGWPYVVGISPLESFDSLFHGILSLTAYPYKKWKNTEQLPSEKKPFVGDEISRL